jgi:hypothetical protein
VPALAFYFKAGMVSHTNVFRLEKGAGMAGKSPQGSNAKKQGKSIKEKRAEKRSKSAAEGELIPKRRKGA